MPLYMSTFEYKPEVWSELIRSPENRTETVSQLLENAGCKLKGLWYALGKSDGFALIEAPDNVTSASLAIAISASGAFRRLETTVLITQDELLKALEKAQDVEYVAPGAAVHALIAARQRELASQRPAPALAPLQAKTPDPNDLWHRLTRVALSAFCDPHKV